MLQFVMRRLLGGVLVLWVVVTTTFLALHFAPGDPAEAALSQSTASEDVLRQRREALGLDLPLGVQYYRFLIRLARLDWGVSWATGEPVNLMIAQQIGSTMSLAAAGTVVGTAIGFVLGVAAVSRQRWIALISRAMLGMTLALPVMYSGTVLVAFFALGLGWLPATGQGTLTHLVLPALAVGVGSSGGVGRAVDAGLSSAMDRPFVLTARAKGASHQRVLLRHGMRVGLLPVLDVLAVQFGFLLGGAVVTESVFARQGLGRLLLWSVLNQDLPVVQAIVVLAAASYTLLNILADLAHAWLDPRVRLEG